MATTVTWIPSNGCTAAVTSDNVFYDNTTIPVAYKNGGYYVDFSLVSANTQKQEVRDMRGLFQIYVVDPEKGKVLDDMLVIAKDKETAKIKTLAPFADKYDLDDLDVICNRLGDVRKKREVAEVRVVKE